MTSYIKQRAWKERTGFEKSEKRRQYKAAWIRRRRHEKRQAALSCNDRSNLSVVSTPIYSDPTPKPGDEVEVRLLLFGKIQPVRGRIVVGSTLSSACPWPHGPYPQVDLVRIPYDAPGTVTVAWEHQGVSGLTSAPIHKVKKVK